jgi:long-chain acyl-CoA synthetase
MINSTMKLVRPKVEQIYKERLEYVYTSEGKKIDNPLNMEALG